MKLTRLIPIASLATVGGVALSALVVDPPADFPFTEPPVGVAPPAPELGIGSAVLHGRVLDSDGAPIANAGITVKSGPRPTVARSRADGTFELDGLEAGPLRLLCVALGFEAVPIELAAWPTTGPDARVDVVLETRIGDPPNPEGITLADAVGSVDFGPHASGTYELLFQPTSAPDDPRGGFPRRVDVAPNGAFEVQGLHIGEYRVLLLAPEDRGGFELDLLADASGTPRLYVHGSGDGRPPLSLVSTGGAARGVVRRAQDEDEAAVRPVRGALVRLERITDGEADATHFRATRTDAAGAFLVPDLTPGRYRVTVAAGRERVDATVDVDPRRVSDVELSLAGR